MAEMTIAIGLIEQGDDYLLQQRRNDPAKGAANLIGCFGVEINPGETPEDAVCREISEETTLCPELKDIKKYGEYPVNSDRDLKPVNITAHAFLIVANGIRFKSKEGRLVKIPKREVTSYLSEMTPATRKLFEQYVLIAET